MVNEADGDDEISETGKRETDGRRLGSMSADRKREVSMVVHCRVRAHDAGAAKKRSSRRKGQKMAGDRDVRGDVKGKSDLAMHRGR